jgi:hypothetical protein
MAARAMPKTGIKDRPVNACRDPERDAAMDGA